MKLGTIKRKPIDVSKSEVVKMSLLHPEQTLPLVIQPAIDHVDLVKWAKGHRDYIQEKLLKHGGILFRGFDIHTIYGFEDAATAICPELFAKYGDLPRQGLSEKIYVSTPYPANQMILFHNESSHLSRWPMKQFFFCVQAAAKGGETPIVDCRKVYRLLDKSVVDRFKEKGLLYIRNFHEGIDVDWRDFFHTSKKSEVEDICRRDQTECQWVNGEQLRLRRKSQAVARHPQTHELVFFNQIQLHHNSYVEPTTRSSLLEMLSEEALPRNVYYGDGSSLEEETLRHLNEAYEKAAVKFPWQNGDVILLDNMLSAHARSPFEGPREIAVAMGEMMEAAHL